MRENFPFFFLFRNSFLGWNILSIILLGYVTSTIDSEMSLRNKVAKRASRRTKEANITFQALFNNYDGCVKNISVVVYRNKYYLLLAT